MELITTRELENFGRNRRFIPDAYFEPQNEAELIQILDRFPDRTFRAVGSLHSWSPVAQCDDVILSVRLFRYVTLCDPLVGQHNEVASAWVGAGIQIKHLIPQLLQLGWSMPSLGLVTEQTLAGAISTGTHGSGRTCLSAFVQAVRIARFDPQQNKAIIETIERGPLLAAAKCGLGNLGIIVAIKLQLRRPFNIEEHWRAYPTLDEVLRAEAEFPLQQFYLLPWKWSYLAQHRREVSNTSDWQEWLYRVYFFIAIDVCLHLIVLTAARLVRSKRFVKWLFQEFLWRTIIKDWPVVGPSHRMLIMEHELFYHIEIELFVRRQDLAPAIDFLQKSLRWVGGEGADLPDDFLHQVADTGLAGEYQSARGSYCHHYPICVRRILPDDSLVSMTSGGDQDWYSISLISYHHVSDRVGFFKAMNFIAKAMARLFAARPHWGKHIPLTPAEISKLYPNLQEFKQVIREFDPNGRFCNAWFQGLLDVDANSPNAK
ncbi:MAG: D-arabinono-1,4-lactone oxidase [Pirellulales bacterium]